ncbi:hypothetical protein PAXRUDRAFT_15446 [Paxillus rubicundulus Ve08.2h10]|uniref:Uncharacterized protein n=1 Tax=Paxillus rubicundulus Ve08.2h10 TaxID=930991 RepID=A0A0D0DAR9_9AGAM|nr:hypothetical protein PAXRUDRAFT_15446 [Paxillus rubicundulus Ve08.2h10]
MAPSLLTALLAQSIPLTLKKLAEQVAFEVAAVQLHALTLTILGDADNLVEEWDMWSDKWNVAMGAMAKANAGTLAKGLTLQLPAAIIPGVQEADDTFGQIVLDAIARREAADHLEAEAWAWAGLPMAEDPAPPSQHTPPLRPLSLHGRRPRARWRWRCPELKGRSVCVKISVVMKWLHSLLRAWLSTRTHAPNVSEAQSHAMGSPGTLAKTGVSEAAEASASQVPRPIPTAAPVAGPSMRPQLSAGSDEEEEVVIVVWAGKGKAISTWPKGVTVDEGDFEEIMWQLLICESKVRDAQAWSAELEGEVLGLKAYINHLRQKQFSKSMSPSTLYLQ